MSRHLKKGEWRWFVDQVISGEEAFDKQKYPPHSFSQNFYFNYIKSLFSLKKYIKGNKKNKVYEFS